jgi:hypothetical protein
MKRRSLFSLVAKALGFTVAAPLLPAAPLDKLKLYDIDIRTLLWRQAMRDEIAKYRADPLAIHAIPFPVTHAESKQP